MRRTWIAVCFLIFAVLVSTDKTEAKGVGDKPTTVSDKTTSFIHAEVGEIDRIKKEFRSVEKSKKSLRKKVFINDEVSHEGAEITVFLDSTNRIRLLEGDLMGMLYRTKESYYFYETGELFFLFSRHTQFPCPPSAEEMDCGASTLTETRLYFASDGHPVRMLVDVDGKREIFGGRDPKTLARARDAFEMAKRMGRPPDNMK